MAKLILETTHRGKRTFYKLDSLPATVGRGLHNDVIVTDETVSPSHLRIEQTDQGVIVKNLSDENGTLLNAKVLDEAVIDLNSPAMLMMGDLKARLMSSDMPVAATRLKAQKSAWGAFLMSPFWAGLLMTCAVISIFMFKYIGTPVVQEPLVYLSKVLPGVLLLFGVAFMISGVSRLSAHRWAFIPALSIAALFILMPQLLTYVGHFLSYFFTSDTPAMLLDSASNFLLLPILLVLYMVKVHYTRLLPAVGVALLVTLPISAFYASDLVDQISTSSGFSPMPSYSKTLSSLDVKMDKPVEVADFIEQSRQALDGRVQQLLEEAKE
ncbi:FHA domain-containing protein [Leucothrix mucor]|uniref:FHA domain-containing protein n=1 Tax=Leucothrix mucor TaxID=45248 RepID=UPI0003B47BC2|nr:FHA domain-containing protein [Leucothrix mucor]